MDSRKKRHRVGDVLQQLAAANEIGGNIRIFRRIIIADDGYAIVVCYKVLTMARFKPDAAVTELAAEQLQKVCVAAANFNDCLIAKAVAIDDRRRLLFRIPA